MRDQLARQALLADLERYQPFDDQEAQMTWMLRRFVREHPDGLHRSLRVGHVTGSAWIVDRERTHVLLTYHGRLERWLQLGGHGEGESSVLETALREAREESGLEDIAPVTPAIFDIDIHPIPEKREEPEHLHYDVRYLLEADRTRPLRVSSESKELAWVALGDVPALNPCDSMTRMVIKSFQRFGA